MTTPDNPRDRILEEVYLLTREIHACAHCGALRQQIARLANLIPPERIVFRGRLTPVEPGGYFEYNPLNGIPK